MFRVAGVKRGPAVLPYSCGCYNQDITAVGGIIHTELFFFTLLLKEEDPPEKEGTRREGKEEHRVQQKSPKR